MFVKRLGLQENRQHTNALAELSQFHQTLAHLVVKEKWIHADFLLAKWVETETLTFSHADPGK